MNNKSTEKNRVVTPNDNLRGVEWEAELSENLRSSVHRATRLNYVLIILLALLIVSLVVLLPLKQTVPYVIRVDSLTGATEIGQTIKDYVAESELNDKHWIKEFVVSRERYNYRLLQHDYNKIKYLAGDISWKQYDELFKGINSLDRQYGENIQITPSIVSITLTENGNQKFATVRLTIEQRDMHSEAKARTHHKVATLRYDYKQRFFVQERDAIENPFGFTVLAYQTDSEFIGAEK